jgi:hypothetical protein
MTSFLRPFARFCAPMLLALGLSFTPIFSAPALAQEATEEPEAAQSTGRPLDGYLATAALAMLALFIVAKSARR